MQEQTKSKEPLGTVMMRGMIGRCPHCGQGKLFRGYLTQVEACSACSERFGHIRTDDGPAWLTILLAGHILIPLFAGILPYVNWPDWLILAVVLLLTLATTLLLLPRSKGVFIGLVWRLGCIGSEE